MARSEDLSQIARSLTTSRALGVSSAVQELARMQDALLGPRETMERALRAAVGPLDSMRHLQIESTAVRQLLDMQEALKSFESRFRLPELPELNALVADQESIHGLTHSLSPLRVPWLDDENLRGSLFACAQLQDLASSVAASLPPFSLDLSEKLRDVLGDWRATVLLPEDIVDPLVRLEFYESRGFQASLTDFPAPAFSEALALSGLSPIPLAEEDEGEGTQEEEDTARNSEAYALLLDLERRLRRFITARLEAAVGPKWVKQRIPAPMREQWTTKKEQAVKRGEPADRPLIEYADFSDYVQIIVRKDNWQEAFTDIFERPESIQESLYRLQPVRIATMHSRILTQDDELFLLAEVRRILRAIDQ